MKLVLLDSLSLLNRAFYVLPISMTDSKGRIVNAVFGYASMLNRIIKELNPTHIVATFDTHAPTFRKQITDTYKATRKAMPEELVAQVDIMKDFFTAIGITCVEKEGFEADDIIGTLAKKHSMETVIVTGDKDSLQLIDDTTHVWLTKRGVTEIIDYTPARLLEDGLKPYQIIELKALAGDSSDNIKGVAGVGDKTARELIATYDNIDGIYEHIDEIKGKLKEKLINGKNDAYLSHQLATIHTNVELDYCENDFIFKYPLPTAAKQIFDELRFNKLQERFDFEDNPNEEKKLECEVVEITNIDNLNKLVSDNIDKLCSIVIDLDNLDIAYDTQKIYTVNYADNLLSELYKENVFDSIKPILCSNNELIIYDVKSVLHLLDNFSISSKVFDLSLAQYVIDSTYSGTSAKDLLAYYGYSDEQIAAAQLEVANILKAKLNELHLTKLYNDIELPLAFVLYDMEKNGFAVKKEVLEELSEKYTSELAVLTTRIYELAGEQFNINSTKQLSEILFNKLNLPSSKKTKTGLSSSASVLAELVDKHEIIPLLLKYRQLYKLNSTYAIGLKKLIDVNGKIHTTFKQTVTTTGRLSSTEPNLQNIPVRDELGREMRKAFVASCGNVLVCADYSQIELRLLAHFSGDEELVHAYKEGKDIHTYTASLVYDVPENEVTHAMRRNAKAVNFGIIYGMSDFGLSQNTGLTRKEAKKFIEKYFETYKSVQTYMQSNVDFAKAHGYIGTITGRIRNIPELKSPNHNIRAFGERIAMNMPLQGTAADIIKIAMLKVHRALIDEKLKAKLTLQIHDELIIDTPISEKDKVIALLKREMENALKLKVPLIVETKVGNNWYEAD